jgi:hypothetical protein
VICGDLPGAVAAAIPGCFELTLFGPADAGVMAQRIDAIRKGGIGPAVVVAPALMAIWTGNRDEMLGHVREAADVVRDRERDSLGYEWRPARCGAN